MEYQYGVRFRDGSVARRWNGNTQEQRAREDAARCQAEFPGDNIHLVRRLIGDWEPVSENPTPTESPTDVIGYAIASLPYGLPMEAMPFEDAKDVIDALHKAGYEIVRKDQP